MTRWTPNAVTVHVTGASPGDRVVYDMNFDPGWRAAGAPAENWHGLVAAKVTGGDELIEISYRPKGLPPGLVLFVLTLVAHGLCARASVGEAVATQCLIQWAVWQTARTWSPIPPV